MLILLHIYHTCVSHSCFLQSRGSFHCAFPLLQISHVWFWHTAHPLGCCHHFTRSWILMFSMRRSAISHQVCDADVHGACPKWQVAHVPTNHVRLQAAPVHSITKLKLLNLHDSWMTIGTACSILQADTTKRHNKSLASRTVTNCTIIPFSYKLKPNSA